MKRLTGWNVLIYLIMGCFTSFATAGAANDSLKSLAVPPEVEAAIKAAPKTGDVYSVTQDRQSFDGQVLKVDVLTFQERTAIVLTNFNVPWVAIVAKKVQFVDPEKNNSIAAEANWNPKRYIAPSAPSTPSPTAKAGQCLDGAPGTHGAPGLVGIPGDTAPKPPKIYFIVGSLVNKLDKPLPQSLNFSFDARGYNGGDASDGGSGGTGGRGGDGGPGDWHGPEAYPFDPGCKCSAGSGGPGSVGGTGGSGGQGGDASPGADLIWVGPQSVLDSLYYTRNYIQGGFGGRGGFSGVSGASGQGGARGEHPGGCQGGIKGATPVTPPTPRVKADDGADKPRGEIKQQIENNISRFF